MDCDLIIPKYSLLDTKRGEYAEEIAQLYCETIDMNRVKKQEEFENMFAQVLYYQVSNLTTACVDWDNNLIGAISYGFYRDCEPTCGRVFKIAVQPQYQRGGVGRELLSYAESCLAGMGATAIQLFARQSAVNFYKKMGYEEVKETPPGLHDFIKRLSLP